MAVSPAQERLPTVRHDVDLHSCPAPECPVVAQLPILSNVTVQDTVAAGNERQGEHEVWAYVHVPARGSRLSGWIIDSHVGHPDSFTPVRSWPVESFGYCIGDYCPGFIFTSVGYFTVMYPACFDGLCYPPAEVDWPGGEKRLVGDWLHCFSNGRLHRAGDVVRAGGPESHEFLYFDKRGDFAPTPGRVKRTGRTGRPNDAADREST